MYNRRAASGRRGRCRRGRRGRWGTGSVGVNSQVAPYLAVLALTDAAAIGLAWHAWRRRPSPGAGWFALFVLTGAIGLTASAGELVSFERGPYLFWNKVQYFGWAPMHAAWFLFAVAYTGRAGRLAGWRWLGLFALPALTLALVWTNEAHGLIWETYEVEPTRPFATVIFAHGPWFWVHTANAYGLYLAGLALLVRELWARGGLYAGQSVALAAGTAVPFVANLAYLSGWWP